MKQTRIFFALVLLLAISGCDWLRARDNMNSGVRSYRETNYEAAANYFQEAVSQDPTLVEARLYLGMSYLQQFAASVPADASRYRTLAIETFEDVLESDPNNTTALAGLASVYQNSNELDRAREYYVQQAQISVTDPIAHYSIGSLNWMIVSDPRIEHTVEEKTALIDEGQRHLDTALELDPDYEDAMTYKNLLYRQAAALIPEDSEDEAELSRRNELTAMADDWFDRAMETRARNAAPTGGF